MLGKVRILAIDLFRSALIADSTRDCCPLTCYSIARGGRGNAIDRVTNDAWSDHRDRIVRTNRRRGGNGKTNPPRERGTSVRNDVVPNDAAYFSLYPGVFPHLGEIDGRPRTSRLALFFSLLPATTVRAVGGSAVNSLHLKSNRKLFRR